MKLSEFEQRFFWHEGDITFGKSDAPPTTEEKKQAKQRLKEIMEKFSKGTQPSPVCVLKTRELRDGLNKELHEVNLCQQVK
jgi:uncharacterized coiled-coil DUF342 family protein